MSIAHAETQTGIATSGTSVATASLGAGSSDSLYVAFIATRSTLDVGSLSGLGLTWTQLDEQCGARGQARLECWYAYGAGTSGVVTATCASTITSAIISVSRYTGVDSTGSIPSNVSYNTLGLDGACSGGTDNDDATGGITTIFNNAYVVAGFGTRNTTLTDTGGWTTRAGDVTANSGGNLIRMSVEDKSQGSPALVTGGGSNNLSGAADWGLILVELKEAAAAATVVPNALAMMGAGT